MKLVVLDVESLAAGGDAVARDRGKVVFVAGAAPGDRVEAEIVEEHAGFARARVQRVIEAGPSRVTPRCPLAAARTCGGCTWQHVARDAQLAAKQAIVAGALRKLDGIEIAPIVRAAPDAGWRRRARLHWDRGTIGFFAPRSHHITDVETCPQLEPRLDAALAAVRAIAPALRASGEIHLVLGERGDVHVVIDGACDPAAARSLVGKAGIAGVRMRDDSFGASSVQIDGAIAGAADDFAQASAEGNRALGELVTTALGPGEDRALLELYAGAGNLTRHARALGWRVTATDAVAPARPPEGVEWVTAPAPRALAELAGRAFDAALLDPPRTGAKDAIAPLAALAPARIIYVSCDPATLARDAQALTGYRAVRATPLDLMPDTAHVEVVMTLERA